MKPNYLTSIILILIMTGLSLETEAQTTITLGTPNFDNDQFGGIHSPYSFENTSSRSQSLILAENLIDQGFEEGIITSLAFNVVSAEGGVLSDFNMSIGPLDGNFGNQFENGLTTVLAPMDFQPVEGWNEHVFDTPYFWDGVSDLVVETCYFNDGPGDDPHVMWYSFVLGGGGGNEFYKESDNMGNTSACDDNNSEDQLFARPHMQLTWIPPEIAPVAAIQVTSNSPCSGLIGLEDVSEYEPTEWLWYFGDGSTSTDQDPTYFYPTNGTYTVSLVVTNEFGTDSIALVDVITVNLATNPPVVPVCVPVTQNQDAGFGPVNVTLNGMSTPSLSGLVGYEDLTCNTFEISQGVSYTLEVEVEGPADNHVVVWIDNNADGDFTPDEKIMSQVTDQLASVDFIVSPEALTDSTLRMRVMSDFFQLGELPPCADPSGGQAEDHGIRITPNVEPPTASFSFSPAFSCDGTIQFTDESSNVPTSWLWQFGDDEISTDQDPEHTYMASGIYTVTLVTQNTFGQDDTVMTDIIEIDLDQALLPACEPQTQDYCCGYGIIDVDFAGISNSSEDGSVGYEDFSCQLEGEATTGMSYPISVNTGTDNPHDLKVYIDFNNDGTMTNDEVVFTSLNSFEHNGSVSIPLAVGAVETRLRMRFTADFVGNSNNACSEPQFGQVEDYSIVILPDTTPPTALFSANAQLTCDGEVSFTNNSLNATSYMWYFGDTNTSMEEEPDHTYAGDGVYTVSLVAINDNGTDSLALVDYIVVDASAICDTINMPESGTGDVLTSCIGYLADDGGPNGVYTNNGTGTTTITVDAGNFIHVEFSEFNYQFNNDFLFVYDGPDASFPLIGQYTGNNLPNGGVIESSGNSLTFVQLTNFFGQNDGFLLSWECMPLGIEEFSSDRFQLWPNPAADILNIQFEDDLQIESILILDMTGRVVRTYSGRISTIDVSNLMSGNYLVEVTSAIGRARKKLSIR